MYHHHLSSSLQAHCCPPAVTKFLPPLDPRNLISGQRETMPFSPLSCFAWNWDKVFGEKWRRTTNKQTNKLARRKATRAKGIKWNRYRPCFVHYLLFLFRPGDLFSRCEGKMKKLMECKVEPKEGRKGFCVGDLIEMEMRLEKRYRLRKQCRRDWTTKTKTKMKTNRFAKESSQRRKCVTAITMEGWIQVSNK